MIVEGKASNVIELQSGDLLLRGIAANYEIDLEDEAFAPGAFKAAISQFLSSGNAPLCFHHKTDVVLGKVLKLEERPGVGLWMEAVLTKPPESSPHYWIYEGVKRGILRGLSVAGRFVREGNQIVRSTLAEISVTGRPMGTTSFDVVPIDGMKALVMAELEAERGDAERRMALVGMRLDVAAIRLAARDR
jgi:HK97 family phage prohead protease